MSLSFDPPSHLSDFTNPQPPKQMGEMMPQVAINLGAVPGNLKDDPTYSLLDQVSTKRTWKGRYDQTMPLLPSPLQQMRIALSTGLEGNQLLMETYKKLYKELPADLRADLELASKEAEPAYKIEDVEWLLLLVSMGIISIASADETLSVSTSSVNILQFDSLAQSVTGMGFEVHDAIKRVLTSDGA